MKNLRFRKLALFFLFLGIFPILSFASEDPPALENILDSVANIINIAIAAAGVAFVIYIGYGAIKASLATGDPRGLEGARQTWVSAFIGMFIIVGVWVILRIVIGFFGGGVPSTGSLIGKIQGAISEFLTGAGVGYN